MEYIAWHRSFPDEEQQAATQKARTEGPTPQRAKASTTANPADSNPEGGSEAGSVSRAGAHRDTHDPLNSKSCPT